MQVAEGHEDPEVAEGHEDPEVVEGHEVRKGPPDQRHGLCRKMPAEWAEAPGPAARVLPEKPGG